MWRAHIFEDTAVVWNVEEFPCDDITFTVRVVKSVNGRPFLR
jgi:hypothetical protein